MLNRLWSLLEIIWNWQEIGKGREFTRLLDNATLEKTERGTWRWQLDDTSGECATIDEASEALIAAAEQKQS